MKIVIIALVLIVLAVCMLLACPAGTIPYKDVCIDNNAMPELPKEVQPSDEKPPLDKMPSYQREGIFIVNATSTYDADKDADKKKDEAIAEGEKAAGITPEQKRKRMEKIH